MSILNARLLAAHATRDKATLVQLYTEAAHQTNDLDAQAFFLTHAYVFALEISHPDTAALRQKLMDRGREVPLPPPIPPLR